MVLCVPRDAIDEGLLDRSVEETIGHHEAYLSRVQY